MELSSLIDYFLKADKTNSVLAEATGKRKREVGLVVPAKFTAHTANRRIAQVMNSELCKKTDKYVHLELLYEPGFKIFPTLKLRTHELVGVLFLKQYGFDIFLYRAP